MRLVTALTLCAIAVFGTSANADVSDNAIRKTSPAIPYYEIDNRPVRVAQETETPAPPDESVTEAAVALEPVPDTAVPAPVAETTQPATAGQPCPRCGQVHQTQPVRYARQQQSNDENIFQQIWSIEKRKNAWIRRTFFD